MDAYPAGGLSPISAAAVAAFATANAQYGASASATVGNTVTETALIGAGTGTLTIPANTFTAGKSLLLYAWGNLGSTLTPTLQLRGKLGGVTALDTGAVTLPVITGTNLWRLSMYLTCRTTGAGGTGIAQGMFDFFTTGTVQGNAQMVNTTTFALNTTTTNVIAFTAQWGAADPLNTISSTNFSALLLG